MLRITLLTFALSLSVARAAEPPASEGSIREMLAVIDARKLVDGIFPQVEAMMKASTQQAMKGRTPSPEEQSAIDKMTTKTMAMMREELDWDKLEPLYMRIYQKSFSQDEVDGLIAFYKSPAGAALIKKMPIVMQQCMAAMQELIGPMMQKTQAYVKETIEELKAEKAKKG